MTCATAPRNLARLKREFCASCLPPALRHCGATELTQNNPATSRLRALIKICVKTDVPDL